jgi:hypothetical protein
VAEDVWTRLPKFMTSFQSDELVRECRRQEESCAYTSSGLFIWHKSVRNMRAIFVVLPLVAGGIAGSQIAGILPDLWGKVLGLLASMIAATLPAVQIALNMDMQVSEIAKAANEFTSLRDRFRQAANILARSDFAEFKAAFEQLMDRMDAARFRTTPLPEWAFKKAQRKLGKGDYNFDIDVNAAPSRVNLHSSDPSLS